MRLRSRHDQSLSHGSPNAVTSFPPLRTPPLSISLTSPRPFHRRSFRFPDSCAFVTSSISGLPIPKSARQRFPFCVFFFSILFFLRALSSPFFQLFLASSNNRKPMRSLAPHTISTACRDLPETSRHYIGES